MHPLVAEWPETPGAEHRAVPQPLRWKWDPTPDIAGTHIYPADTEVLRQGLVPEDVFFVDDGLLKLIRVEPDGRELIIALRSRGWILGTAAVIVGRPSPVAAVTLTRCRLLRMTASSFQHWLRHEPDASWQLHEMHAREAHELATRVAELAMPSSNRLRRLFEDIVGTADARERKSEVQVHMPLRWLDVARLLGVTPQHLSRLLRQLEDEGSIRKGKGCVIVNRHLLRSMNMKQVPS
jgi:CRP-like cAMP-binding protein